MINREHLTEDQISIYAEAISSGKESTIPEEWRRHVAECEQCAHEVAMVSQIIDEGGTQKKEPVAESSHSGFLSKKFLTRFGVAASIVVIIGAGVFFTIMLTNNPHENIAALESDEQVTDTLKPKSSREKALPAEKMRDTNKTEVVKDSAGTQKPGEIKSQPLHQKPSEDRIKLAYVPDENLEKLAERFESASMRGDDVTVISPHEIKAEQGNEILIELKNPENTLLILEFFNNKGEKLFEKETSKETWEVKKLTEPGLYYWKLLSQDFDLLYCGKIIVED